MTQQAVEQTLGKLMTDERFRRRFFAEPAAACREAGLVLSPAELDALTRLSGEDLARVGGRLDPRISRPCLDPTWREHTDHDAPRRNP